MRQLSSSLSPSHTPYLRWAIFTTVGSALAVGYFLSRQWWFAHPVPLYFWGSEIALIALFTAGLWWLAWDARRAQPSRLQQGAQQAIQHPAWLWVWGWVVWLGVGMALTPSSFWIGNFQAAVRWQHSLLMWFWLVWAGSGAWLIGWKRQGGSLHRPRVSGAGVFLAILAAGGAAVLLVVVTGLGWRAPNYWQGIGVPILSGQIWLLLTLLGSGVTLGRWLPARWRKPLPRRDVVVFLALWAAAFAVWWWSTPAPAYFQPAAFPPNYQRYPFSDAEKYGLGGEQGVLGYGYLASASAPRGGLSNTHLGLVGLLALIEVIAKTATTVTLALVLLLAITPALLYLLGAMAHSRSVGLLLAGIEILRERNAILHADLFHVTSHVHMWATEPLLRAIFILLALAAILFLQRPWQRKPWLFAVGALIAFGFLVRKENMVLMALSFILVAPVLFANEPPLHRIGKALALSGILLAGMAAVFTPWMVRGSILSQRLPYARRPISGVRLLFHTPIETVLSPTYRADILGAVPSTKATPTTRPSPTPPASPTPSPSPTAVLSPTPTKPTATATPRSAATATPKAARPGATSPPTPLPPSPTPGKGAAGIFARLTQGHGGLLLVVGDLFTRNLLALALAFPPLLRFYPMLLVVREKTPLWAGLLSSSWYHLPAETTVLLGLQALALALGMAVLWRKRREALLVPLGIMLVYLGVSAAARDAGGRYVVPLDWVLPLFATVGWVTWIHAGAAAFGGAVPDWLRSPLDPSTSPQRLLRTGWRLGGSVALLSLAMVVLEFGAMGWVVYSGQAGSVGWRTTTPPRWRPLSIDEFLTRAQILHLWDDLPWSRQEVLQALRKHEVRVGWGYLFYPRYVSSPEKCGGLCDGSPLETPHLIFAGLLGAQGQMRFHLALETPPPPLRDGSEMLVIYCKPRGCAVLACSEALALIQVTHPPGAPPQGQVHVFLPPHPSLSCSPPAGKK